MNIHKVFESINNDCIDRRYLIANKIDRTWDSLYLENMSKNLNDLIFDELKALIFDLQDVDVDYVLLKGISIETLYYKKYKRNYNDIDFLVRTHKDYEILKGILIAKGYHYKYIPMFLNQDNSIRGVVVFTKYIGEYFVEVEINIGGIPVEMDYFYYSSYMFEKTEAILVDGLLVRVLSDELNLIVLIIEIYTNRKVKIRDLIDFYFIFNKAKEINNILETDCVIENYAHEMISFLKEFIYEDGIKRVSCFPIEVSSKMKTIDQEKKIMDKIYKKIFRRMSDSLLKYNLCGQMLSILNPNNVLKRAFL